MKDGFYSVRQAGVDQDPLDADAWGLAMLVHLKDGTLIGVDQGGCKISGRYAGQPQTGVAIDLVYEMQCGSHLPDGTVLTDDFRIEHTLLLDEAAVAGRAQRVDIGLGPMLIRLDWLGKSY